MSAWKLFEYVIKSVVGLHLTMGKEVTREKAKALDGIIPCLRNKCFKVGRKMYSIIYYLKSYGLTAQI